MLNIKNIETLHPGDFPPRFDTYYQDEENKRVFISNLCQPSERNENIRMARFIADKTHENIFVLPHIQPTKKGAENLRKELFPEGVKENKNPDYYFRGRFVDGKSMISIIMKPDNSKAVKRKIQNRFDEAFEQADDVFIEINTSIPMDLVKEAVKGKLASSQHRHIVYVKYGDDLLVFGEK